MKIFWGVVVCWLLVAGAAAQSLGSQMVERQQLIARTGYAVKEMRATNGATVREYVSPAGVVFGVAWQGPTLPDLSQLLGTHFAAYQAAARIRPRRGPLYVHTGSLVVENSGHMRAFHGRAYLTDALPANLTAAVVQ